MGRHDLESLRTDLGRRRLGRELRRGPARSSERRPSAPTSAARLARAACRATVIIAAVLLPACRSESQPAATQPSAATATTAPAPARPNVLLLTLDTTRADRLGCYGYPHAYTPSLDRLAADGVRYARCYSPCPLTLPAHATMLTGLYPFYHGVLNNGRYRLPDEADTLAERFAAAGYRTGAVLGAFVLDRQFGLSQGFADYDDDMTAGRQTHAFHFVERVASQVTDAAIRWLDAGDARPFFLWAHYYDPHAEYDPPETPPGAGSLTPYDGEIAYMDAHIGRLLAHLDAAGAASNTLVVAVGDHGEALWEHGEPSHGYFVHDSTLRVPLIVRFGDRRAAGAVVSAPVGLVDLYASILGWAGLATPQLVGATHGQPLPTADTPDVLAQAAQRAMDFENAAPAERFGWAVATGVRRGDWKLIELPAPELYDVATDPHEETNELPAGAATAHELAEAGAALRAARLTQPPLHGQDVAADAETIAKLHALGYTTDAPATATQPAAADLKTMLPVYQKLMAVESLLDEGRKADAADIVLEVARTLDPHNPRALWLLAHLSLDASVRARVLPLLAERASEPLPARLSAFVNANLGRALWLEGRPVDAVAAYRRAIRAAPDAAILHWDCAGALAAAGGPADEIVTLLERSAQLDSSNVDYVERLSRAYAEAGRFDAAIAACEHLLERRPLDSRAKNNLAWYLARGGGDLKRAEALARQADAADPDNVLVLDTLGYVLIRREAAADAIDVLERAVKRQPDMAIVRYHLGLAYEAAGRRDDASSSFKAALANVPASAPNRDWVADLRRRASGATTQTTQP